MFDRFTRSLDVIAHEITHGVTQYSTKLKYKNQAGALNEHISDVFAILTAQYTNSQSDPKQKDPVNANWLIGREIFSDKYHKLLENLKNGYKCDGLRSVAFPETAYDTPHLKKDPQPDSMINYNNSLDDHRGVHINSGIPNKAFYLFAKEIKETAWETAGRVWYTTITSGFVPPDASFKKFAKATLQVAQALPSGIQTALRQAWTGVHVIK